MSKYYTASVKTGFMVESFDTFDEAVEAIGRYQRQKETQQEVFQIVDEDHYQLHRYVIDCPGENGKRKLDSVIARDGYNEADYAREHGLKSADDILVSIGDI